MPHSCTDRFGAVQFRFSSVQFSSVQFSSGAWLGLAWLHTGRDPLPPRPPTTAPDSLTRTPAHGSSSTHEVGATPSHSHGILTPQGRGGLDAARVDWKGDVIALAQRAIDASARGGASARTQPRGRQTRGAPPTSEEVYVGVLVLRLRWPGGWVAHDAGAHERTPPRVACR